MIFNEIYGNYFLTVQKILSKATNQSVSNNDITKIVLENAFGESMLSIPKKILFDGEWGLLDSSKKSILNHSPIIPLTTLQKRWLKTLLQDPRIALFDINLSELDNIAPLYERDTFIYYDKFSDGDPYESKHYQHIFKTILHTLNSKKLLQIKYPSRKKEHYTEFICQPKRLEYSIRDDKFRLIVYKEKNIYTYNISKIINCMEINTTKSSFEKNATIYNSDNVNKTDIKLSNNTSFSDIQDIHIKKSVTVELVDKKNTLERVMHQFSFYEKSASKIKDNVYKVSIIYEAADETDILIKIMSFGATVKVLEPQSFINQIKNRLYNQKNCEL